MISASFGSATLYKNMTHSFRRPFERQTELRKTADDQRPRRVVLEHDHPRTFGDLLLGVARVREEGLAPATHRHVHLAHLARRDRGGDPGDLADQLMICGHPRAL